ncbi:MAG: hypothetical protein AVDCRST_MAG06-3136 [uncultured Nocardioides sp.]|uniref:Uncharacterized protein n=1 Tax=uncultured Nocardioides sp. TaxID=198441 RepID=A0A6J4PGS1_9ACTN|nr:MAG: hypothetical protein AVDCRST_MAG06-3136 [uncultured Nocardioides sp.]
MTASTAPPPKGTRCASPPLSSRWRPPSSWPPSPTSPPPPRRWRRPVSAPARCRWARRPPCPSSRTGRSSTATGA